MISPCDELSPAFRGRGLLDVDKQPLTVVIVNGVAFVAKVMGALVTESNRAIASSLSFNYLCAVLTAISCCL